MKRTSRLILMVVGLVGIWLGLFSYAYVISRPLEDVVRSALQVDEVNVVQVDQQGSSLVALLLVNQRKLQIVSLEKNWWSPYQLDDGGSSSIRNPESIEDTVAVSTSIQGLDVLIAEFDDRYYVATQMVGIERMAILFARTAIDPSTDLVGLSVSDACEVLICTKNIQTEQMISWFSFNLETRPYLMVVGLDENGKIVDVHRGQ